jgi:hypothetical protein
MNSMDKPFSVNPGAPRAICCQSASNREGFETLLRRFLLLTVALGAAPLTSQIAKASAVTWDVDPTNSYIRLTIPDQTIAVPTLGDATMRMRDATSTTQWTDAGGRRAALDGEIATDYVDGTSITFLGGSHNLYALEATSLRPNPAAWDAATTNYTDTSTALAALGGRGRASISIFTVDAAFVAFRSVHLDITNSTSGTIAITNGSFATNTTRSGISTALLDVDGLPILTFGQPVPDVYHGSLDPLVQQNAGGGSVSNLGGLNRKLTYTIDIPNLSIDLSGTIVTGSAAGLIVAYAVIPAPPTPPTLSATRQGPAIVLAWPTNAAGFSLEYTTVLPATNWVPASPPPVAANGQNVVTNLFIGDAAFYRLHKP